jgi:O-antigen/teichoic acid export membrane protein
VSGGGAPSARLRTLASQSAIYGIGPVVARFAGLLLLPIYTRHLGKDEVANVGQVVALVAVGATIAQLGLVNALFRFAAEREGDARFGVARTAIALCCGSGVVVAAVAALATPLAAPLFLLGHGHGDLWLVACAGLLISLLYEPCAGLYRVEQRPQRFLVVTLVNVAVTVVVTVVWILHFDGGALAMVAGSFTGTLVALGVVLWDRRAALFGPIDLGLAGPLLRFGLPFMPSRVALWALNLSNRLLVGWLATGALAGVYVVGANLAQAVALLVTAFQLAWPPFAYGIEDDGEARVVYRSVLTVWLLVALAVVLPLALARDWLVATLAGEKWLGGADAMALTALGLAFYGAYYVVGVAVGRAKRTQLNWVVTGIAAVANVLLCIVLIPEYGVTGAGVASAIAYFLMALLMVVRGNRVFPVGYDWARLAALCLLAASLFAVGELGFASRGAGAVAGRVVVAALFVPLALSLDRAARASARRS